MYLQHIKGRKAAHTKIKSIKGMYNDTYEKDLEEKEISQTLTQKVSSRISTNEIKKSSHKNHRPTQQVEASAPFSAWVGLNAFPSLHPMVVHLPVVLLPFALLLFVIEWRSRPEKASLAVIISAMGGATGAIVASFWLHPHVASLNREALALLVSHEFFAYTTTGLVSSATICLGVRYFRWNHHDRKWYTLIAFILLVASSFTVSATGHLGATLSHVHEVNISPN